MLPRAADLALTPICYGCAGLFDGLGLDAQQPAKGILDPNHGTFLQYMFSV